jgi:hypothetical protein
MSNEMTDLQARSLEQLNPSRRRFFGKLLAGTAAVAALPVMSSIAMADDDDDDRPRGKGKGRRDGKGKGKGGRLDPAQLAARLIEAHDKDGDGKLSVKELTAALRAMQSRRGRGKGEGKGGPGRGKGKGQGKGKGGADRRPKKSG